jgi:hypothetical protein
LSPEDDDGVTVARRAFLSFSLQNMHPTQKRSKNSRSGNNKPTFLLQQLNSIF